MPHDTSLQPIPLTPEEKAIAPIVERLPLAKRKHEIIEAINFIAEGGSFKKAAKLLDCEVQHLWRVIHADAALEEIYSRARTIRAAGNADQLTEINQQVLSGDLAPDAARVVSGNLQWLAARQDGKRWGDKQYQETSGTIKIEVVPLPRNK